VREPHFENAKNVRLKAMKLLIWNFSQIEAESSNFGDRAIFRSLVADIKKTFPGVEIFSLSSDPQLTSRLYGVNAFHFNDVLKLLMAIRKSDMVILGGGEFIQDKTSLLYLIANLSIGALAIALRRPMSLMAIGVADEDEISFFGRLITRLILNKARFITVRDPQSKLILNKLKVSKPPIHVTADASSRLPTASRNRVDEIMDKQGLPRKKKLLVGVVPRRMLYGKFNVLPLGVQIRLNIVPSTYYYQNQKLSKVLAETMDNMVRDLDAGILFIPMYEGKSFSYRDRDFAVDIMKLMQNKNKARILSGKYSPEELKGVFGQLDLVIGMTLHSLIMAAMTGVPTFAISYSSKMDRFIQMMGQEEHSISIKDLTVKGLSAGINIVFSKRESIREELIRKAQELQERAFLNIKLLSDCLSGMDKPR